MPQAIPNPLLEVHRPAEAEFQSYGEVEIPATFGEPQAEYAAIHKGAALLDCPQRGILEVTGRDRLPFLNNLLTNEVWRKEAKTGLTSGQGLYAFFLNTKGRIATDMNVLELGDRTHLELEARMVEPLRAALDRYLFAEQAKLINQVGALHQIALHGPAARDILYHVASTPIPADLRPLSSIQTHVFDVPTILWRDDPTGASGLNLILPIDQARTVWMKLIAAFGKGDGPLLREASEGPSRQKETVPVSRLRPAGWAAFNAARIEAGRPLFGIDFDDSVLPAETGLLPRAVSFTKGCYLGQEIVARMHARGQLARQLVGIRVEADALPIAGAKVFDDQHNEVGGVTSSTLCPILSNAPICLGYVKKQFIPPGTRLQIPAEGALRPAIVVQLPFIPPRAPA